MDPGYQSSVFMTLHNRTRREMFNDLFDQLNRLPRINKENEEKKALLRKTKSDSTDFRNKEDFILEMHEKKPRKIFKKFNLIRNSKKLQSKSSSYSTGGNYSALSSDLGFGSLKSNDKSIFDEIELANKCVITSAAKYESTETSEQNYDDGCEVEHIV